ncbi:MAG TPA: hypothetical protein VKB79_07055 [Bryobacteraceae bacterium]|jgi:hypothetical protein|nr:hypothetical protein [Bryobacteraceae bacterium]
MPTPSLKKPIRKGQVTIRAIMTFALAWGLFAGVMPLSNREKAPGALGRACSLLLIPVFVQVIWFAAGAAYSASRKRLEAIVGILVGFGIECAVLAVLILISASVHY